MNSLLENKDRAARNLYLRLRSCDYCRDPLSLADQLSGPCPRCGTSNPADPNLTPEAARALLNELTARRRELGLSERP